MSDLVNYQSGKQVCAATTAVDIDIELGWEPKYVKTWCVDGTHDVTCEWWETMGNGGGMLTSAAGVVSTATTGITILPAYVDESNHANDYNAGFRIGVGAQYESAVIYWMAF
jgi:hypothetical protein